MLLVMLLNFPCCDSDLGSWFSTGGLYPVLHASTPNFPFRMWLKPWRHIRYKMGLLTRTVYGRMFRPRDFKSKKPLKHTIANIST